MRLIDLFESAPTFYGSNKEINDDSIWVLVRNAASADWPDDRFNAYHGNNVIFSKETGEVTLTNFDAEAQEEAKKYEKEIIKAAHSRMTTADWKHLLK